MSVIPTKHQFDTIYRNVQPHVHRTPIHTSQILNEITGTSLYFKCENFQKMGAFKMRGAIAALSMLSASQKKAGVVTHSSGNFAQALSLAAKKLNIPAYIVMPTNAPKVKIAAVTYYGGNITMVPATLKDREAGAAKIIKETGATFIHPSNDLHVILGQGTAAKELLEDYPNLDILTTPVGGGGLLAGTAVATHYYSTSCNVIGTEPANVDDAYRSFISGSLQQNTHTNTIADGLRTQLGNINFPIIQNWVQDMLLATEDEIIQAMKLIWQYLKIVIEPSSAVPLAAIIANKTYFKNKHTGIIISGGNVDINNLPF